MTLIQLIESFMHDGELSDIEIYDLADWLNKNQNEVTQWPGNLLVEPLQKAWHDKKIAEEERQHLFLILNNILNEHYNKCVSPQVRNRELPINEYDSVNAKAELPKVNQEFEVDSTSMPGERFKVELLGPSCTCPDWISVRSHLPEGTIPRACKHILACFRQINADPSWTSWFRAYLKLGYKSYPNQRWAVAEIDNNQFLYSSANPEWGNVFCKMKGEDFKFGFSIFESRWSYGKKPPAADELAELIVFISNNHE